MIFTTIYTGTNFAFQVSNPVVVGSTSLEAVTLRAVGKNGAVPNTFDSDQGGTGITTTTNALHQIWEFGAVQTPTLTLNVPGSINQALDSHFLVNLSNLVIVHNPSEDRVANPTYDPWGGFGTYLRGTFSILGTSSTSWDFAYLVVPSNTTVNFDFHIGGFIPAVPNNQSVSSDYVSGSFTVVPEPSTLVLLGSGILGLLVYRRRRGG